MARFEVTAANFPGRAFEGTGTDTLVLVGGGAFDFDYVLLSGFSQILIEAGIGRYTSIRISGEQLADISFVGSSYDYTSVYLTGSAIDLRGKTFDKIRYLSLASDNATVTVASLPLALKIDAFQSQGETIVLDGPVATQAARDALHRQGFDKIVQGANVWTDAAPTLSNLSGGQLHVRQGQIVRLDPEADAVLSDDKGFVAFLDIALSNSGYLFPMSHFKLGSNFQILNNNYPSQTLLYKGSIIGSISSSSYDTTARISFHSSTAPDIVSEFVRDLAYTPGDFVHYKNVTVAITALDQGGRKSGTTVFNVTAETNWTPTEPTLSNASIVENAIAGTVVGTLKATDANGDAVHYRLTDDAGGRFSVVDDQIVVSGLVPIDFEVATKHRVTVVANDGEQDGLPATFTISIVNVLENVIRGTAGKDRLVGGAERDFLFGGLGNDILTGNGGKDAFVFNTKLGTATTDRKVNFDKITDFKVALDSIWLDDKIFNNKDLKLLGKKASETNPKKLNKKFFTVGDKAKDKDDYIVYNKKTGVLSYDPDGSGSKAAIEFAQVTKGASLRFDHFFII